MSRFNLILILILTLFEINCTTNLNASEYFVAKNNPQASDSNPGTKNLPWATIQHAANIIGSGDICYVEEGIYNERISISNSGTPGNFITFKANQNVVVRGFVIQSKSYIRIIGFEITHNSSYQYDGININNSNHCQILNNYIHHTYALGIITNKNSPSNYILIRGNTISYTGSIPGNEVGEIAIHIVGNHNIVEYNDISHVADFTNVWGQFNIVRNNYFHDCYLSDYPDYPNSEGHHIDAFQYYSASILLTRNLMENNFIVDNVVPHSHILILRDIYNDGSSEFIYRRNVGIRNGSYAGHINPFIGARFVANTFVDILYAQSPKANYCISYTNGSRNGKVINNIFYNSARSGGMLYYVDGSSQNGFHADYNLAYLSGNPNQIHGIIGQDPSFFNYNNDELYLQNNSPAINAAGPITTTIGSGNGTNISVADAGYFMDGWGITDGDYIQVGNNSPVQITNIDYNNNIITIDNSISWNSGEFVCFPFEGDSLDIGAFEYKTTGYDFDINITNPANGTTVRDSIQIQADVTNEENIRYVVFYVNGVPMETVNRSPFTYTWNPIGNVQGIYKIKAKAFNLYASTYLSKSSEIELLIGTYVLPPQDLKVTK